MAHKARKVVGLEIVPEAVADAQSNAELKQHCKCGISPGRCRKTTARLVRRGLRPDVVELDPPRRGCHIQVLETIADTGVPRVIYVSCDPGTLARDLRRLVDCGYIVEGVQSVDMFPHTQHVETVVIINIKHI